MATTPQHDPDLASAIDDARDPLCLICRASFRVTGCSLCSACLHANQDADAEPSHDSQHGHAA